MEGRFIHLGIRIEKSIYDQLKKIARAEERPMSALVRKIIKKFLKSNADKSKG
jgi:predicted DNA-binding ribbon-helix-helix protein